MKILFLNQAFHPDVVASGQVLADAAAALTGAGHDVTVIASARGYDDPRRRFPLRETWNGVAIRRVPAIGLGKERRWRRAVDFAGFLALCSLRLATVRPPDVIVAMSSPPLVSVLGAAFASLRGGRFVVWMMDLNPDEALAAGWLRPGSWAARLLERLMRFSLRRADRIVVLDRFMRDRLSVRGIEPSKLATVPPWSHDDDVAFDADGRVRFRERNGLSERFVVMYAGNHSPCHPLDTLLHAARELRTHEAVRFVFVGGGSETEAVRRFVAEHDLDNVIQLPYQPLAELGAALSGADLQAVVLGERFVGIVHPSKIYNALRVRCPVLYIGPSESHITDLAAGLPAGVVRSFGHGDIAGVVGAVQESYESWRLKGPAGRGAESFGPEYSKAALLPKLMSAIVEDRGPGARLEHRDETLHVLCASSSTDSPSAR